METTGGWNIFGRFFDMQSHVRIFCRQMMQIGQMSTGKDK